MSVADAIVPPPKGGTVDVVWGGPTEHPAALASSLTEVSATGVCRNFVMVTGRCKKLKCNA